MNLSGSSAAESCHIYMSHVTHKYVMSYIHMSHVTRYVRQTHRMADMGWLRLVGLIKLQVSFAKEPYKRGDILQKRPII